jgi:hypothetical protein
MKRSYAYTLTASLCVVAAAGCRGEPESNPPVDMASANDLAMPEDMSPPPDLTEFDLLPPPPPTEFMVVRIGDGTAYATGTSAPVFVEKRQVSDGAMVGAAIALPTAVAGTNKRLTLSTSSLAEGGLSLSADGRYVVLGGYDADVSTANVASMTGANVNRVIGRIDAAGAVDTSTAANFFSGQGIRGAASTDGTDLWAAGPTGIVYTTLGTTAAPTSLFSNMNMRWPQVLGAQLYSSSSSAATRGINTIGTGTPKTATAATLLAGFETQNSTSHYGFVAFDRVQPVGLDVIYVADDRTVAAGGGVQRWSRSGTTWSLDGRMSMGLVTEGARGLTGYRTANSVTLLVTTAEMPPRIVKFVDDGTALDQLAATQLVAGTTNNVFRGIALAPK